MSNFGSNQKKEYGTVSHINTERGFGFLRLNSSAENEDTFFHSNEIQNAQDIRCLRIGDEIECFVGDSRTPGKREAKQVYVLTDLSKRSVPDRSAPDRGPPNTNTRRERSRSPRSRGGYPGNQEGGYYTREFDRDRPSHNNSHRPPTNEPYRREQPRHQPRSEIYQPQHAGTSRGGTGYSRDFRDLYTQDSSRHSHHSEFRNSRRHSPPPPPVSRGYDRMPPRRSPHRDPYDRYDRRGYSPPPRRDEFRSRYDRRTPPPRDYHPSYGSRRSPPRRPRSRSPPRRDEPDQNDKDKLYRGKIVRIHERGYGFIKDEKNPEKDWFFPAKEVRGKEITDLELGDQVMFKLGKDYRSGKWEAQEVIVQKDEWMEGKMARLKDNFGFIETATESIYFHGRHIQNSEFSDVKLGDKVSFLSVPSRSRPGTKEGQQITVIEDFTEGDQEEGDQP